MTTTVLCPDRLEAANDLPDTVRKKTGETDVAESVKKAPLLLVHALIVTALLAQAAYKGIFD